MQRSARIRSGLALATLATALAAILTARSAVAEPIDEVPSGTKLGKDNWEVAKGHLPDEILEFYKRGEYSNPIIQKPGNEWLVDPNFVAASEANRGKYDIDENGTVVEATSGQRPPIISGLPFPEIEAGDPKAGQKAIWNWFYSLYWEGAFHTNSPVNWVSRDGLLRRISTDVHFKYYDGNPPEFQKNVGENPLNILSRTIGVVNEPADVNGIVNLNWRYREGDKDDQAWTYVPALRRVRPINPANRSDGLLGSDISLDDGPYFDGKPEDFTFKVVGEGKILAHFDGPALEKGSPVRLLEEGEEVSSLVPSSETGWRLESPEYNLIASQEDGWKRQDGEGLIAWAPMQYALVPRPVWIIEATPKNPYYLYGKQILYLDKDTYRGYWKNKYDWKGNALANWATPAMPITKTKTKDGKDFWLRTGAGGNAAFAVNYKQDRATVTGMPVETTEYHIQIPDEIYEVDRVNRMGK
jgi:hypothetical protein